MSDKWLYQYNKDDNCRFILGTVGKNPLICIGVNPSTAEPNNLDNTLQSVHRIAVQNGHDSWIMLNLYPQRSTDPNKMDEQANEGLIQSNYTYIRETLQQYPNTDIWAAWGTLINKRTYLRECLFHISSIVAECQCRWVTFGNRSKDGHPHHPLYLKMSSCKEFLDIDLYQNGLLNKKRAN